MPEIESRAEETLRFNQPSVLPSERNCFGRREEPRMLNGERRGIEVREGDVRRGFDVVS